MQRFKAGALLLGLLAVAPALAAQKQPAVQQIAQAISPLPEPLRAGATVMAFAGGSKLELIRKGSNPMICLPDDPDVEGFHAACYHRDLEPFMEAGRRARAEGLTRDEVWQLRIQEIDAGKWSMPQHAVALYSVSGPDGSFDYSTGSAPAARSLHVIYVPYATEESIGVSTQAANDRPWLMNPGTPFAHLMISRPTTPPLD
jgi:hypothetical protein